MEFGRTPELIEYNRRVFLIAFYAWAGLVFLLPLGLYSLIEGRMLLGAVLLANTTVTMSLMVYSRVTRRVAGASYFFSFQAGVLAVFLAVHGGIEGSGVYFSFPLALVMVMLGFTHLRVGVVISLILVSVVALGLYGDFPGSYAYASTHRSRIVMALSAACMMSLIAEWMRNKSYEAIFQAAERLNVDASHDSLTGLLNRRGFEEQIERMNEDDFPAVLGVIDIDHFKKINDEYGHDAGDKALRFLGDYLRRSVKGRDLMCRWGGEEFLVLFPHLSFQSGVIVLDQIRDEIYSRDVVHGGRAFRITFSAGVVELDSKREFQDGLKLADRRLYHAKKSGRNRVVADQAGESGEV
ncbi:MAG TPA: GGDEF domain-containing protein [Thiobacillus sp.]